jgi:hypothetical protein
MTPPDAPATRETAVLQTPSARLARSREQLRLSLQGTSAAAGVGAERHADAAAASWLETLSAIPGAGLLVEAAGNWWARHPLRAAAIVAAGATTAVVTPIAQRHPLGLVAGALVFGGLLAWSRPWRWAVKPALFAGLAPQLLLAALRVGRSPVNGERPPAPRGGARWVELRSGVRRDAVVRPAP